MSRSDEAQGAPSNSELAERTARIEQEVHHVAETVERIEERVVDEQDDLEARVEENEEKVATVYVYHKAVRYGVPILGAAGSFFGGMMALGVF